MSQFCVPAVPGGQSTTQVDPAAHIVWQGPLWQAKRQTLFGPHEHCPSAQTPSHFAFEPAQSTWQGGEPQVKEQVAPVSQVHVPLEQVAEQVDPPLHTAWHGGAAQPRLHCAPEGQMQVPLEQSVETLELHAASATSAPTSAETPEIQTDRVTWPRSRRSWCPWWCSRRRRSRTAGRR
jgi:hypothetical protein